MLLSILVTLPQSSVNELSIDWNELECLSKAIYLEARGEPFEGRLAVAHTIINRTHHPQYPDTICEVVHQPHQITGVHRQLPINYNSKIWEECVKDSFMVMKGLVSDVSQGAIMYYAHNIVTPYWRDAYKTTVKIGGHTFLK